MPTEPKNPRERDPFPLPTDFSIEGPFHPKHLTARTLFWLVAAVLALAALLACVAFTIGAVLRSQGVI